MVTVVDVTSMLTWQADDKVGLEGVRLLLLGGGLRALGRMVRAEFTASYRLVVDDTGVLHRVSITSATHERERHLTLNRSEEGNWLADSSSGSNQRSYDGALDVDLAHSVLFNSLPIRRLGLHRDAGDVTVKMVYVTLPDLEVQLVDQRYHTVSTLDADGRAVVGFSWDEFSADIAVDPDGVVLAYPGVATRLAAPVSAAAPS